MKFVACVAVAACGGSHAVEDAKRAAHGDTAEPARDATGSSAPGSGATAGGRGDLAVRVEWHDVPVALRTSPVRAGCATPRLPAVAPTTTWGVPDVFVVTDIGGVQPGARVVVGDAAVSPRVAVGKQLEIASAAQAPIKLVLTKRGQMTGGGFELHDGAATTILLPIAGHEATVALDANAVYELAGNCESAWIVTIAAAVVTDAAGVATFRDLPAGNHQVRVFLPPRGVPAKGAGGSVAVAAGALAEVTIQLAPPP